MARCEAPSRKGRCPNKAIRGRVYCSTHWRQHHREDLVRQTLTTPAEPAAAPVAAEPAAAAPVEPAGVAELAPAFEPAAVAPMTLAQAEALVAQAHNERICRRGTCPFCALETAQAALARVHQELDAEQKTSQALRVTATSQTKILERPKVEGLAAQALALVDPFVRAAFLHLVGTALDAKGAIPLLHVRLKVSRAKPKDIFAPHRAEIVRAWEAVRHHVVPLTISIEGDTSQGPQHQGAVLALIPSETSFLKPQDAGPRAASSSDGHENEARQDP